MSKLILLIHNQSDIDSIPAAAQAIVDHGYKGVWVLHSPAIAVDQATAAAKYDKEIADLQAAESAAAGRGDYNAASEHQLARRGKELERGTALAGSWKAIPEDARIAAYQAKLEPLRAAFTKHKIDAKVNAMQDHFEPKDWQGMLNTLTGAWFKPFTPGSFSIAWPGSIPALPQAVKIPIVQETPSIAAQAIKTTDAVIALIPEARVLIPKPKPAKSKPAPEAAATTLDARRSQLTSMPYFTRRSVAAGLDIDVKGKNTTTIVNEILTKEFPQVLA